jgi:hypothetical protein
MSTYSVPSPGHAYSLNMMTTYRIQTWSMRTFLNHATTDTKISHEIFFQRHLPWFCRPGLLSPSALIWVTTSQCDRFDLRSICANCRREKRRMCIRRLSEDFESGVVIKITHKEIIFKAHIWRGQPIRPRNYIHADFNTPPCTFTFTDPLRPPPAHHASRVVSTSQIYQLGPDLYLQATRGLRAGERETM